MQIINPLLPIFTFPIPIDITKFTELTGGIHTDLLRDAPTRVSIRESKTFNTQRTLSTWVSAHWGENIPTMECSGNIIDYPGQEGITALSLFILRGLYKLDKQHIKSLINSVVGKITSAAVLGGVTFSEILQKNFTTTSGIVNTSITGTIATLSVGQYLMRIMEMDEKGLSPTYIMHDNYIYQGYFTDFQYTRDINNPRLISYSFKLNIEWNSADYLVDILKNQDTIAGISGIF